MTDTYVEKRSPYEIMRHLWKVDDREWVVERKEQWRLLSKTVCKSCTTKRLKAHGKFFLTGEEPPDNIDGIYDTVTAFVLTPFTNAAEASELYQLITHPQAKNQILSGFMSRILRIAPDMPWLRAHVLNFIEGILGDEYRLIKINTARHEHIISPDPTAFCEGFTGAALKLLRNEQSYNYSVDTVSYFVSALPYADDVKFRKYIKLQEMLYEADKVMQKPGVHSDLAQDLARELKEREDEIWKNWKTLEHLDQSQ